MIIGVCELELRIPFSQSLKDKRNRLKSLLKRMKNKFNIAAAEVDHNESRKLSSVGVVTVSNESKYIDKQLDKVIKFVENDKDVQLIDYNVDFL